MDRLLRWLELPIHILLWVALAAGLLMMLHVTADVAGRTVFNHPLNGTTEIVAAYYMVVVAYLPWAWIARRDSHIAADIFVRSISPQAAPWMDIAVKVLTAAYVSVFSYQTLVQAIRQTRAGEVWLAGTMHIPVWPSRWMLPIAGFLMALHLALRIAQDVVRETQALVERGSR